RVYCFAGPALCSAAINKSCSVQRESLFLVPVLCELGKWIGARNPVRIGSSCAAVTGYDFPLGQSPKRFRGGRREEGAVPHRHQKPGARIFVRSTSFVPRMRSEKTSSQKEE